MSFVAQDHTVYWITSGGSYALKNCEIVCLLGIFDRERDIKAWLDLDAAAQAAGYPASVTTLRAVA